MTYQLPKNAYPASLAELPEGALYMADLGDEDGLFFAGESCPVSGGTPAGPGLYRLPMNHETARRLWELLPWTSWGRPGPSAPGTAWASPPWGISGRWSPTTPTPSWPSSPCGS